MADRLYTTAEAAEILGIDRQRLRQLAADRDVGRKQGIAWMFTAGDLDALRVRPTTKRRRSGTRGTQRF